MTVPWQEDGIISTYKFYLAFENSIHCTDYISEKFWRNSLKTGAVPVVFGPHKESILTMKMIKMTRLSKA